MLLNMEYKDKLKIKPWNLPLEEVERMPGVTLEDLKRARYGDSLYPVTWSERIEDIPEGFRYLSNLYFKCIKTILQSTIDRGNLLRGISQALKGRPGVSTRAYQHAAFWLYASTKEFKEWVRKQSAHSCHKGWEKVKKEGVYFDFEFPELRPRDKREFFRTPRNGSSGEAII